MNSWVHCQFDARSIMFSPFQSPWLDVGFPSLSILFWNQLAFIICSSLLARNLCSMSFEKPSRSFLRMVWHSSPKNLSKWAPNEHHDEFSSTNVGFVLAVAKDSANNCFHFRQFSQDLRTWLISPSRPNKSAPKKINGNKSIPVYSAWKRRSDANTMIPSIKIRVGVIKDLFIAWIGCISSDPGHFLAPYVSTFGWVGLMLVMRISVQLKPFIYIMSTSSMDGRIESGGKMFSRPTRYLKVGNWCSGYTLHTLNVGKDFSLAARNESNTLKITTPTSTDMENTSLHTI